MGFIEQVKTDLISNGYPYPPTYRVVLMGSSVGYFENVVGISLFSQEKIVLSLKKGSISIVGKGLWIKKFCCGDLTICGKIDSVTCD